MKIPSLALPKPVRARFLSALCAVAAAVPLTLSAIALSACSMDSGVARPDSAMRADVPTPVRDHDGFQGAQVYWQATVHWKTAASAMAASLARLPALRGATVHVTTAAFWHASPASPFADAFMNLLDDALTQNGVDVVLTPHADAVVTIDTQVLPFESRRLAANLATGPGAAMHSRQAYWGHAADFGMTPASQMTHVPVDELILTIKVTSWKHLLFSDSELAYVPRADRWLYVPSSDPASYQHWHARLRVVP